MGQTEKTGQKAKYEVMKEEKLVRVKVPSRGSHYLNVVPAHSFEVDGKPVSVPTHYRHGQMIGDSGIIVNRHFYSVTENDLGKTILATVKVVRKTAHDQSFIMLDIMKEERVDGVFPKKTLKIMPSVAPQEKQDGDIRIPMTGTHGGVIRFEDYTPYTPERFQTAAESVPANQ